MSRVHTPINAPLAEYIRSVFVREPEPLRRLREDTEDHPQASMQTSPEQGQFLQLLARMAGARKTLEVGVFMLATDGTPSGGSTVAAALLLAAASAAASRTSGPTPTGGLTRPWWVELMIPVASAKRGDVLRNACVLSVLTGVWCISMMISAFMKGSELFPYRWWVVTFFAAAAAGFVVEFRAIRWMDRAGTWQ